MTLRELYLGGFEAGPEGWTSEFLAIPAKGVIISRECLLPDCGIVRLTIDIPAMNFLKARRCDVGALTADELAWHCL